MSTRWMIVGVALLVVPASAAAQSDPTPDRRTVIYFVRHGEVEPGGSGGPTVLSEMGKARAKVFAASIRNVRLTHVFSSHTIRARQMVEPAASTRGLAIVQLPQPGSLLNDAPVEDRVPSREAVAPLVAALKSLPIGSKALVGVNSDNIYAILNGLGVPVPAAGVQCPLGDTCVPCLTNECFPGGYDQLWLLIIDAAADRPHLIEFRYGVPN